MSSDTTTQPAVTYTKQTARRIAPRVAVVVIAGLVVWLWGQSARGYQVRNLTWAIHIMTTVGAIVYAGVALHVARLADAGRIDEPYITPGYALIAPATLTHEWTHATAARLIGGSVGELSNDGGAFAIAVDLPADRSRVARAAVDVAPTLVGIPLVIAMAIHLRWTLGSGAPMTTDLLATVAFIYCQFYALPSGADLRSAWATLSGTRDRARLERAVADTDD